MEGDSEKTKISYLHHWLIGEGISKIEGWKNSKVLISQSDYKLEDKTGKYSLDKIESYFTLCQLALTPRSNPLLAVEDLYLAKQGCMTSGEFHSHICRAHRDGGNSQGGTRHSLPPARRQGSFNSND